MHPPTLWEISLKKTSDSISSMDKFFDLVLPTRTRSSLMQYFKDNKSSKYNEKLQAVLIPEWLETNVTEDELTEEQMKMIRDHGLDMWDWSTPMLIPPDLFAHLMSLRSASVAFFIEDPTHVILAYYSLIKRGYPEVRMCPNCYRRDTVFTSWNAHIIKTHEVLEMIEVIDFMQDSVNWCDNCILTPLFSFLDEDTCRERYHLHTRLRSSDRYGLKRRYQDSDDDSDSDEFGTFTVHFYRQFFGERL